MIEILGITLRTLNYGNYGTYSFLRGLCRISIINRTSLEFGGRAEAEAGFGDLWFGMSVLFLGLY